MTIRKGEEWGEPATVPHEREIVVSDADLAAHRPRIASVAAGDLHRALGSPPVPAVDSRCTRLTIDALECIITTSRGSYTLMAASSVVVGRWLSRGRFSCLSNTGWWRDLNLAPRAHPNDGEADLVAITGAMSMVERVIARRRAAAGAHLPHPDISVVRVQRWSTAPVRRGEPLAIDGRQVRGWRHVEVRVRPDYFVVLV